MRFRPLIPLVLALAGTPLATAQTLLCPPSPSSGSKPCDIIHFHVAMYRPDTRVLAEFSGINQFASQSACDRARDAAMKRNEAVVAFLRQRDQQYQVDRFGPCHCDQTVDKASANYLQDGQRTLQVRQAEEIRQLVRGRLLDNNAPSDSELVRSLYPPPAATPLLAGPKLIPPPAAASPGVVTNATSDLRMTKAAESTAPSTASLDLPLVEIPIAGVAPDVVTPPPATTTPALPEVRVSSESPAPTPTPAPQPVTPVAPEPPTPAPSPAPAPASVAPVDPAPQPPDETAETFVTFETDRIQSVLKASGAVGDESISAQIFQACRERIQLLSNLRSLIAGSGARSRLAAAVRNAKTEADRLALVSALFGSDMPAHWAPKDAKDVILEARPEVDNDAEKILRDAGGRSSPQQKKRALYVILARASLTEEQQLWLGSVIDAFLQ